MHDELKRLHAELSHAHTLNRRLHDQLSTSEAKASSASGEAAKALTEVCAQLDLTRTDLDETAAML